jgi:hypothetical protein
MTADGCQQCGENTYSGPGASSCTSCPGDRISGAGSTSEEDCYYGENYIKIEASIAIILESLLKKDILI